MRVWRGMEGVGEGLLAAVDAALTRHRRGLELEYGWTQLELAAQVDAPARALRLRGQVALPRLLAGVRSRLTPLPWAQAVSAPAGAPTGLQAPVGWSAPVRALFHTQRARRDSSGSAGPALATEGARSPAGGGAGR